MEGKKKKRALEVGGSKEERGRPGQSLEIDGPCSMLASVRWAWELRSEAGQ